MKNKILFALIFCAVRVVIPANAQDIQNAFFFDGNKTRGIQIFAVAENGAKTAQFFYKTRYYNLYFPPKATAALKAAFKEYNSDFSNQKLSCKKQNTAKKYGAASVALESGSTRQNIANTQTASAAFGYAFAQNSPYFAITVQDIALLFTKAQASEFIKGMEN